MDDSKNRLAMPKFTPKKMVMVLLLLVGYGSFAYSKLSGSLSEEAIEARLAPAAQEKVEGVDALAARQEAQKAQASGPASIYKANCSVCHQRGIAGAPKWGDKKAWAPRIDQGMEILFAHSWNGYKGMPPKGNCLKCSKEDIQATIDYMLEALK